jgi:hypothetical protein
MRSGLASAEGSDGSLTGRLRLGDVCTNPTRAGGNVRGSVPRSSLHPSDQYITGTELVVDGGAYGEPVQGA